MSDLEDLRIINEMTYIVWLHSVYFIMGSVQESLSNHVQHPVYCIVGTMFKNLCPIMYNILFIALWVQCSRIIVQSCTTSCLLHCGYNVQESLSNHVQHPVYCIVGTLFKNHCPIMYNILFIALWVQCSRIIVQSCTTSCLLHCGYNVQESLSNHVQHPVYCNVDTQSLPRVVGPYTLSSLCQES